MTHADIIARLEAATGPDRELDALIDAALRIGKSNMEPWAWKNFPVWRAAHQPGMCEVVHDNGHGGLVWDSQPFTASVDACLALIERTLPGWMTHVWCLDGIWQASISHHPMQGPKYDGMALTEPRARLLALFRALETQEPHHG